MDDNCDYLACHILEAIILIAEHEHTRAHVHVYTNKTLTKL